MENNIYAADTSGVGFHVFLNIYANAFQINIEVVGFNAHDGEHAGAECSGNDIGRRESFPFAMVVGWSIGFNQRLALHMRGTGA